MTKRFSTLSGIKREAKKRSKLLGISHSKALEEVCRNDGYSNFKEARAHFINSQTGHEIRIWQNYRDDYDTFKGGAVEGTIRVQKPPAFYMNRNTRKAFMGLEKTRGKEIYRINFTCTGRDAAQQYVEHILRFVQFSQITGFLPTTKSSINTKYGYKKPAWADHIKMWEHSETGDILFTEEPYPSRLTQHGANREGWAALNGYNIADCEWGSVYSDSTRMILITPQACSISAQEINPMLKGQEHPISLQREP